MTSTKKIILLNGPPRSGKDTLALALLDTLDNSAIVKFAAPLKKALVSFTNRLSIDINDDRIKDEPQRDLFGVTPRQFQIAYSEQFLKPLMGNDVFGKIAHKHIEEVFSDREYIIISDSGFAEEAQVLIQAYGITNVMMIQLHREGTNFNNDSRSYVNLSIQTYPINNDSTVNNMLQQALTCIATWESTLRDAN